MAEPAEPPEGSAEGSHGPSVDAAGVASRPESGTRADLHLLRRRRGLALVCLLAVVVPFAILWLVLSLVGHLGSYWLWVWAPAILAGVLLGAFLDRAQQQSNRAATAGDPATVRGPDSAQPSGAEPVFAGVSAPRSAAPPPISGHPAALPSGSFAGVTPVPGAPADGRGSPLPAAPPQGSQPAQPEAAQPEPAQPEASQPAQPEASQPAQPEASQPAQPEAAQPAPAADQPRGPSPVDPSETPTINMRPI